MEKIKKHVLFIFFILFFLGINCYKVISDVRPFYDWDESIYVQLGKEMIQAHSPIPLWQGKVWLDKPPLVPFTYGLMTLLPFQNEVSMRVLTVLLSAAAFTLIYFFAVKYSRSILIALATVVITAYLPSYLQRNQVVNVDVFLVIGWFGYALFYKHRFLGTLFLLIGVLSKSLLGFYPLGMIFLYEFWIFLLNKKKGRKEFYSYLKTVIIQFAVASLWFIWAFALYRQEFIQYHFLDNQLKRVTASIEQHFGQRTFYIDLLLEQIRFAIVPAIISICILGFAVFRTKSKDAYFSLLFVPWFLFLNLTKTKIAWYLYPVLPQFVFLAVFPIVLIKKPVLQILVGCLCLIAFFQFSRYSILEPLHTTYSHWESHITIAQQSNQIGCKKLFILVSENTRTSYETLRSMDLVIHTTTWWGDHPSMAYYSGIKTYPEYTLRSFQNYLNQNKKGECFIFEKNDYKQLTVPNQIKPIKSDNRDYVLLQR